MTYVVCFRTCAFVLLVGVVSVWAQPRPLTLYNVSGATVRAFVEKVEGDEVVLRREDGHRFRTPLKLFRIDSWAAILREEQRLRATRARLSAPVPSPVPPSEPEQAPVGVTVVSKAPSADVHREINETFGVSLLADDNLWDDPPGEVAGRLRWPPESHTIHLVSHRLYPPANYRFLGARPHSAAFCGETGKVTNFSFVFANKGDCFASAGSGRQHFKEGSMTKDPLELEKWIEQDAETIGERLEDAFGKARRQNFGQGSALRRVSRWDWSGHSFLLSVIEGEFVSLSIETVASADARGKARKVADMHARRIHRANVQRRPNGDVVINNLPMVDQGPKGYCVPATFERCMRYMQVPADMYLLAMAGNTKLGGGTVVGHLLEAVQGEIWSAGRNFRTIDHHPTLKEVGKWIDDGVPIIWDLYSTDRFNDIADERTAARRHADIDEWAREMRRVANEAARLPKANSDPHIVLIHGYNKETGEIAFTDSWGEKYRERWITLAEASRFSGDNYWVIDY